MQASRRHRDRPLDKVCHPACSENEPAQEESENKEVVNITESLRTLKPSIHTHTHTHTHMPLDLSDFPPISQRSKRAEKKGNGNL